MRQLVHGVALALLGLVVVGCGPAINTTAPHHSAEPSTSASSAPISSQSVVAPSFPAVQSGINVEVWGDPSVSAAATMFSQIDALHLRAVSLVIPFSQSSWQATNIQAVGFTPSPGVIARIIQQAYSAGLAVMLRPILDEGTLTPSGHWRGDIEPVSKAAWFANYANALKPYAIVAQKDHVGAFDIGTELSSLESDTAAWMQLIHQVRAQYQGSILYSFNWNSPSLAALPSWTQSLTWVGLDAYYPLNTASDSVSALTQAWQPWVAQADKIPRLLITEAGVMPKPDAWQAPWVWNPPGPTGWAVQAQYYTAATQAWKGHANGIYWWGAMLPRSSHGGASYDPLGHPSADVIAKANASG